MHIIETKTSWSVSLLEQALMRRELAHYVSIAAPETKRHNRLFHTLCRDYESTNSFSCPFCGARTKVLDSRGDPHYNHTRRRRQCLGEKCAVRFTTIEIATIVAQSAKAVLEWASSEPGRTS